MKTRLKHQAVGWKSANTIHKDFCECSADLAGRKFDVILADLECRHRSLTEQRGFSFRFDGPLDMRMDNRTITAADIVNSYSVDDLTQLIIVTAKKIPGRQGELRRQLSKLDQFEGNWLADLIKQTLSRGSMNHPATRTFQGATHWSITNLRWLKNYCHLPHLLNKRWASKVDSFHSLEDRLIKRYFFGASNGWIWGRG